MSTLSNRSIAPRPAGKLIEWSPLYVGIVVEAPKIDEVARRMRAMPEVRYLAYTTGPWDLLAEAFVGSASTWPSSCSRR